MASAVTIVFFGFLASIIAFSQATEKKETFTRAKVQECFAEQKSRCGDLICEMSTDDLFYVVEQVESNVMDCLDN